MGRLSCFGPATRVLALRHRSGSVPSPKGAGTRQSPGCAIPRTDEASGDRYPWPPYAPGRTAARGWELTRPSMRCGPLAFGGAGPKNMQNREDIQVQARAIPLQKASATSCCDREVPVLASAFFRYQPAVEASCHGSGQTRPTARRKPGGEPAPVRFRSGRTPAEASSGPAACPRRSNHSAGWRCSANASDRHITLWPPAPSRMPSGSSVILRARFKPRVKWGNSRCNNPFSAPKGAVPGAHANPTQVMPPPANAPSASPRSQVNACQPPAFSSAP